METSNMTPDQIRKNGMEALIQALGPVGMVRFFQEFNLGSGDYKKKKKKWLDKLSVGEVVKLIERDKQKRSET